MESERQATYRLIENDEASIDTFTKLRLEAKARDLGADYENEVVWRSNNLIHDLNFREQRADWLMQTQACELGSDVLYRLFCEIADTTQLPS